MAHGWVHGALTLVGFGLPYFDLHRTKDAPSRILGPRHRNVSHDWYQQFGSQWTLTGPYPASVNAEIQELGRIHGADFAELRQVSMAHDHIDRLWDTLD